MERYKLSKDAEDDLKRLYRHGVLAFGLARADQYFDALFERFDQLAENPLLYRAVDDIRPGYRRSACGAHAIYYRITAGTVEIMRILGRENPDTQL
ncbi:MAG: type II toxin-antitoxin system RelE/ParE family toxin [Hyphomicrobiales bacterium]|nr:type II toxin-antitoxin system RelE/ParE family toxin [Hyphomicrobiales bacterium]